MTKYQKTLSKKAPKQVLEELKQGKAQSSYFLYGEEPYKIEEFIKKVKEIWFGISFNHDAQKNQNDFSVEIIDGSQSTGNDVLNSMNSFGLFSMLSAQKKMVIVKNADQLKDTDDLLTELEKNTNQDALLFLVSEKLDLRKKLHSYFKEKNCALEFTKAKDQELITWVHYIGKKYNLKIEPQAATLLAIRSDGSLFRLENEIIKCWLYLGGSENLSLDLKTVQDISTNDISYEVIELSEAICVKKIARALLLADKVVQSQEQALGLVGFLTWTIKNNFNFEKIK